MFNQRPNTLDWRDAAQMSEPLSYWSPTFPSPQDVIKALDDVWRDYYMTHERLAELMPASRQMQPNLAASHVAATLSSPIGPAPPTTQPPPVSSMTTLNTPVLAQPPPPPTLTTTSQQQQQQPQVYPTQPAPPNLEQQVHHRHQSRPPQVAQSIGNLTVQQQVPFQIKVESQQQEQLPPPQQENEEQHQQQQQQTKTTVVELKARRLTDEERLRHKRERNRRAAANCRRRKDEKLKSLSEENAELRRTIESLQTALLTLQNQVYNAKPETTN